MKKSLVLLMIVAAVISLAFVSCDANTAPQADILGEIYLSNDSQSRGITVSGTNTHEVESLYWYYKAVKNDNGLFNTGVTKGFVPVNKTEAGVADKGLENANLGFFSYGNWTFTFYGVKEAIAGVTKDAPAESIGSGSIVYSGSQTIEVNKDRNFLNLTLNEGAGLTTEIEFDTTEGVWFSNGNIKTGMAFSLAVVDKVNGEPQGTITSGTATVEAGKVSFKNMSYIAPEGGIAEGQHVMTFTLTQTGIEGTTTNIAKVATFELAYTVSKGMTYTVSGDLTKAEVTGEVSVGSNAVSVPETTASKVIPVKSADSKVVKTETTVSTLDLTVKYPVGAKLADTTNTSGSGSNVTADATIGFKLDPSSTDGIAISGIGESQELTKYTLTLNVAEKNEKLIEVSKFIGKDLEIEAVYHKGNELPDNGESYEYNPETGILTLKVYNASPIDVVTKKVLAVASIGDEKFTTLQAAIEAAVDGDTITILRDVTNAQGIAVGNGVDFTIDFGDHTYTLNKPGAGSTGTETNGFQLKKTSTKTPTITFKNGTINISEDNLNLATEGANIKRIIQNYCNLNLIDMTIDGTNQYGGAEYVMSFNNGTVNISGNTNITAAEDEVAFDVDGNWGGYGRSIVNIDTTGTIVGNIEVGQGYLNLKNANVEGGIVLCTSCGEEEITNQKDRISVTGGTFSSDPSEYIGDFSFAYDNGNGTYTISSLSVDEDGTYLINNANDLVLFEKLVNERGNGFNSKTVKLANNIDLADIKWKPIGQTGGYTAKTYFQGTFDGNGKTISNLNIPESSWEDGGNEGKNYATGFFGFVDVGNTTIRNVTFKNATVYGHHWVGVAAGYMTGTVEGVKIVNSTVSSTYKTREADGDKAGGVVGFLNSGSSISGCTVNGSSISAVRDCGSVVGYSNGTVSGNTAENCTVYYSTDNENQIGGVIAGMRANGVSGNTANNVTVIRASEVSNNEKLNQAISAANKGDTVTINVLVDVTLDNGIANDGDKSRNITFRGNGTQTVDVISKAVSAENGMLNYQRGSSFTFEDLIIQAGEGPYDGIVCDELTFKNCTIKGKLTLYGKATFINCTFDNTMANQYSIWTWGGTDVTFQDCTFNTNGKAILLYGGASGSNPTNLVVNDCTFNDRNNGTAGKAAIEIGNDYNATYTLTVNNATVNGFADGLNTGSKLWANKNSMDLAHLSVTVDGSRVH